MKQNTDIRIRQEKPQDYIQIRQLVKESFATAAHSDGDEHCLIERLRLSPEYIPALSLVALSGDTVIGHIMFSKIAVGHSVAVALAPVAVRPSLQRQGIGNLLITTGHALARDMGYHCSVVLGDPLYYARYGYVRASDYGIATPFDVPGEYYMVCPLGNDKDVAAGPVRYSDAFGL